jgi:hypothetical protein
MSCHGSRLPTCPAEQIDHRPVERRDIVRLAARHEVAVGYDFLIYPLRAGVPEIGLERRPRGDAPPARGSGCGCLRIRFRSRFGLCFTVASFLASSSDINFPRKKFRPRQTGDPGVSVEQRYNSYRSRNGGCGS